MAVINITKENFAQEVLHSEKPVVYYQCYLTNMAD